VAGGLLAVCALLSAALPATAAVTLTRTADPVVYVPGDPVDLTVTIALTGGGTVNAVGVEETLPAGWQFDSLVSGTAPAVAPLPDAEGVLSFGWFPVPALPVTFTYRVKTPIDAAGTVFLQGTAEVLVQGEQQFSPVENTVLIREGDGPFHTADINFSATISLSELLRVIQFYNFDGFHCADFPGDTEDGYVPGLLGNKGCGFHLSDYNSQDWRIQLTELLRLIQFYNAVAYQGCTLEEGGEDGFCPIFPG
jgi:hypothetical protein